MGRRCGGSCGRRYCLGRRFLRVVSGTWAVRGVGWDEWGGWERWVNGMEGSQIGCLDGLRWFFCHTADQKGWWDEPRYNVGRNIPAHWASGAKAERVAMV